MKREVKTFCVHPTWFMCSEYSKVDVFQKNGICFITVNVCDLYVRLNELLKCCYICINYMLGLLLKRK